MQYLIDRQIRSIVLFKRHYTMLMELLKTYFSNFNIYMKTKIEFDHKFC